MKKLLKQLKKFRGGDFQIFTTPNWVGDKMSLIWEDGERQVWICLEWGYIEAFGFSDKKLNKIRDALK